MRLIDADVLQEHFEKVKKESESLVDVAQIIGIQAVIDSQTTAYDVDKTVKRIDELREECSDIYQDYDPEYFIDKAIEIVKSGGENGH